MASTELDEAPTRDERFKHILRQQLGDNGVQILVNQSVLFVLALILIITVVIGAMTSSMFSCVPSTVAVSDYNPLYTTGQRRTAIVNNRSTGSLVSVRRPPRTI